MRRWHVALLIGSLALAAIVLAFAAHQSSNTARRAAEASSKAAAETAVIVAADKETPTPHVRTQRRYRPVGDAYRLAAAHGLRLQRPARVRSTRAARAYDPPPAPPGPAPTLDVPATPDVPALDVPDPGPDVCQTDPPDSLDACADRPTAGSMLACIQYYVDCYG
jgi:hypothetical protein